jgi:hypothetical protein
MTTQETASMTKLTDSETKFFAIIAARCAERIAKGATFGPELIEQEMAAELAAECEMAEDKTERARLAYDQMARVLWREIRTESGLPV